MQVIRHGSPNFGPRRGGVTPDLIVLHYTAMDSTSAALARLCDAECEVSAHYLIAPVGQVYQMVDEEQRAWHAGAGSWGACDDVNSRSVGIELANTGAVPFAAPQMDALEHVLAAVKDRWHISPERVIAHSDMAPLRKFDPGPRFDWRRLALNGLAVWPAELADCDGDTAQFLPAAQRFGYPADAGAEPVLSAFRQRFRPWATGPLDATDLAMIEDLAARFPVDQHDANP